MVGLGGADLQQWHHLSGRGVVLAQAQVCQFEHLLEAGAGPAQNLDDRPGPESLVFGNRGVESPVRLGDLTQDQRGGLPVPGGLAGPLVTDAVHSELLARLRGAGGGQDPSSGGQLLLGGGGEAGQDRGEGAGALVHAGLTAALLFDGAAHVGVGDRARRGPLSPQDWFFQGPVLQVEVERADGEQDGLVVQPRPAVG